MGASSGIETRHHRLTARPMAARKWAYRGSRNRVRAQNVKNPAAARLRSTPCRIWKPLNKFSKMGASFLSREAAKSRYLAFIEVGTSFPLDRGLQLRVGHCGNTGPA